MRNLAVMACCLMLLLSCGDSPRDPETPISEDNRIAGAELPQALSISPRAEELIEGWPEFQDWEQSMDKLYRVENDEDLRLLLDEILEKEEAVGAGEKPPLFDKPQIYSRIKVIKTYLLKARAQLEYRRDPTEALLEMMEAYNALRREFNVLINNSIETDLIPDE